MSQTETIITFNNVSFSFGFHKKILDDVSFSVRQGLKVALMGQNGAGKTSLFKLMTGQLKPEVGSISIATRLTVATAHQVIEDDNKKLTILEFFGKYYAGEPHELKRKISGVLQVVNLNAPLDKIVDTFSGGQQARLLLAAALIQDPDVLLLDEPTNNLDYMGIYHLTEFLMNYKKSCIVISHDAEFLNAFTQGILYLDSHTKKIEQYAGDYYDALAEISARIEKENRKNALLAKEIQENKEKANFFAHKGGKMRNIAKKMWEKIDEYESEKVDVRKEDRTIRPFQIPVQRDVDDFTLRISSYTIIQDHQPIQKKTDLVLGKSTHLQIVGPNGIGKSTFIESLATGTAEGVTISPGIRIGYYRQDFSTLDYNDTAFQSLSKALNHTDGNITEEQMRAIAAGFLINKEVMKTEVGYLSEGQKGLLSFARLVLQKPGLLILDEPTNHINFRHLPVIASALNEYQGIMILISHIADFVAQIRIDQVLDLEQ